MSFTNAPTDHVQKPDAHTKEEQSAGTKVLKTQDIRMGQAADLGRRHGGEGAPPSRVYTKDYLKKGPDKEDSDTVTEALGNPLRW
jgi:hypothetical protein